MTDLNNEDAHMLQGLQDALMHLTNRLLSATEVANSVAELITQVTQLQRSVSSLTSDVETYRNRNLDLDAALSAVRKERDSYKQEAESHFREYENCYRELTNVRSLHDSLAGRYTDIQYQLDSAVADRDAAVMKQLEAEQALDEMAKTLTAIRKALEPNRDVLQAVPETSKVEAVQEPHPVQAIEDRGVTETQIISDDPPSDEGPKYDTPRYSSSW